MLLMPSFAQAQDAQDNAVTARAEFVAAVARVDAGQPDSADSKALSSYMLYPYVLAARLQRDIKASKDNSVDARTQEFLGAYSDYAIARDVRKTWLRNLAQRQDWVLFKTAYRDDVADDDLRCQQLQARIATNSSDGSLRDDALKLWMNAKPLPQSCTGASDWLQSQGSITPQLAEQRARLALVAGNTDLAEPLLRMLAPARAAPLQRWLRLIRNPKDEISALIADPSAPVEAVALLDGYTRLARKDYDLALQLYQPLLDAEQLKGDAAGAFTAALAMSFATSRQPQAVEYFKRVPEALADDRVQEWRVRAALWNGDWLQAREWLSRMPKALASQDRWMYWRARALEQDKATRTQAQEEFKALSAKNNIFAVLAAWRLGRAHTPTTQPLPADKAEQAVLLSNIGIIRAKELHLAERDAWASAEWRKALSDATVSTRAQAGLLAARWGWYSQGIPTLAQASVYDDFSLTYPLAFESQVQAAQKLAGISPAWINGVMRQESLFNPDAVSSANAYGLMQLILPTAHAVAKRWKQPKPSREDLFQPQINLLLGAAYLRELNDKYGNLLLALGSYNAGPAAVARWLPDQPMDADIWMENVPFNETRGYIQRNLWNIVVFGWKETGKPQDISAVLMPIKKAGQ
jgi:soluble lytic murein transglycosylase